MGFPRGTLTPRQELASRGERAMGNLTAKSETETPPTNGYERSGSAALGPFSFDEFGLLEQLFK